LLFAFIQWLCASCLGHCLPYSQASRKEKLILMKKISAALLFAEVFFAMIKKRAFVLIFQASLCTREA
jgi:hypothetical protein